MDKDLLSQRKETYNQSVAPEYMIKEISLRKESESIKQRKNYLFTSVMSKRMKESIPLNNLSTSKTLSPISSFIHQRYSEHKDKLLFITHLLHSNTDLLNYIEPIDEDILIEHGISLLTQNLDNHELNTKEEAFFFSKIYYNITDKLTSPKISLNIKLEISLLLANMTNNEKICKKYSIAFCDQLFLFNLSKSFVCQLESTDKQLLANIILIISNIMSENINNYHRIIDQIIFLPMLQTILSIPINNPWVKLCELSNEDCLLLENSFFLLYNFFFYMNREKMIEYFQFEILTIKLLNKAYQEGNQEKFLMFLEIVVLFTKSKEVITQLFSDPNSGGLFSALINWINNSSSVAIAINSIRIIKNIYFVGPKQAKRMLINSKIEEIVFKNIYLCTNENALSIYLELLTLFIKRKETITQLKLNNYKDFINSLENIFNKAQLIKTKVETLKAMRAIIERDNDEMFKLFYGGDFWKGLLYWLKDNSEINPRNVQLIFRVLRLIEEMIRNCPKDYKKTNSIKVELETKGLSDIIERFIDSSFPQIEKCARDIFQRYWSRKEYFYGENIDDEMNN